MNRKGDEVLEPVVPSEDVTDFKLNCSGYLRTVCGHLEY